ncbi:hypothetical protein MSG28_015549 [Choristoneura fumiferana]|uniref:Uncharacterized protein n=1 Tax=Choristoneura fumiferana TaxID=7141 RepID=A0ACC0KAM7_CHOFU|nr:hypothetical protein MSG28_015549 [Choristoneura fumiferana]
MIPRRTELATLQRQVDSLGRSLQSAPPSARQAPASHLPAADRNVPTAAGGRPDHPGADSPGHTNQPELRDQRRLSKQASRTSLKHPDPVEPTVEARHDVIPQVDDIVMEHDEIVGDARVENEEYVEIGPVQRSQEAYEHEAVEEPVAHNQEYEHTGQEYVNSDQNYVEKTEPYYEGQELQNEGYDPNYQQNYQEGQFENYEQYPQQQYTDPNAQYTEGQYDNYATDGTYQQEYDPTQFAENTFAEPQTQYKAQTAPVEQEIAPTDSKRSNSPEKGQS